MLYISELCEECAIAYEIYKRNLHCVNPIPGIHDNGPRDHELWRRTLTAYKHQPIVRALTDSFFTSLRPVYTASGTAARHGITAHQKSLPS